MAERATKRPHLKLVPFEADKVALKPGAAESPNPDPAIEAAAERANSQPSIEASSSAPLAPDRHPNLDFFLADLVVTPKDDIASMEHPVFALKPGDTAVRKYEHNGYFLHVIPSVLGHATIHDKDILIYCISQVVAAADSGGFVEPARVVRLTAHDLLVATNRPTDGRGYERLKEALDRLVGTRLKTNVTTAGKRSIDAFGVVDWYRIVEKTPGDGRMIAVDICLSEWSYRAALAREVLTLSKEYFRLRKPLEKRLYELARKHCGAQESWKCSVELLHKKSGAKCALREFRRMLTEVVEHQHLPDYSVELLEQDTLRFWNRATEGGRRFMAAESAAVTQAEEQRRYEERARQEWERANPGGTWPGLAAAFAAEAKKHPDLHRSLTRGSTKSPT
jgi:Replication initiator protein A